MSISLVGYGQVDNQFKNDSSFTAPSVIGLPRSKGLVISREIIRDYRIRSTSDQPFGNSSGEIRRNRRWEFKLRLPVLLKENLKIAAGVQYSVEEFNFDDGPNSYPFYQNLEDRPLRSIRGDVIIIKPTRTKRFYILRVSGSLNGDYDDSDFSNGDFFRFSVTPLIGWKKNDYTAFGFGASLSYNFGRRAIFPVITYNHSFNNKWGVEAILPANAKLRFSTLDQKNFFYLKTELKGNNYSVRLEETQNELFFLNNSEVRFLMTWEREIHDWLWFGVESGLRSNINFDLSDSPQLNAEALVDNDIRAAFVFNFSLFVVPPRKFLK
ncbi:MAG: DUF6268 family outer membrane beta-barrel protein [Bacteroidota bacterium]